MDDDRTLHSVKVAEHEHGDKIIRVRYDLEGCHAEILECEGNGHHHYVTGGYEYVRDHGNWEACRDAAVARAKRRLEANSEYGPTPEPEVLPYD